MKSYASLFLAVIALLTAAFTEPANANPQDAAVQDAAETKQADAPKRMSPELLWKMGRLGEAAVSPDGTQIVFTVRRYELAEDAGKSSLHLRNLSSGKETTIVENWKSIGNLQWSKTSDGDRVFFIGLNGAEEEVVEETEAPENAEAEPVEEIKEIEEAPQAWSLNVESGDTLQITSIDCLLYTSPSPRDQRGARMPSSA